MDDELFYVGVKGLIENKEGKILLLQAIVKDPLVSTEPYWDLPGGRVQEGQTIEEALRREIEEETSVKNLSILTLFTTVISNHLSKWQGRTTGLILVIYKAQISGGSKIRLSDEHLAYEWVDRKEAAKRLVHKYPKEFTALL